MLKYIGIDRVLLYTARRLLYLLVRTQVLPAPPAGLKLDPNKPVVYVMQRRFLSNLLVLSRETATLNLPSALDPAAVAGVNEGRSFFFVSRPESWFGAKVPPYSSLLRKLVNAAVQDKSLDVQLVPVSILWGRSPDKENSIWELLFSDGWARRGSLHQILTILVHGRHTLVRFDEPLSLRQVADEGLGEDQTLRKVARILRIHFRRQREAAIGPDLSHRRTQVDTLLSAAPVQAAIAGEPDTQTAQRNARRYAMEIASDYSYPLVRVMARFLTWIWTRLYDGVEVAHMERINELAHANEIIYVPCHRSHIDYLLLSYLIFNHGMVVPHIAAGANLNLPLVGSLLRRGGAFFLRRSFKGNPVYAAVFNEYLHMMISKGYPIEYFVEGGRSRTGRQLPAKPGMLAMTVQSYLRDAQKPIVFLPVYIGYEKIFEGRTYIGELLGQPKKKESLFDLLLTVRELKKAFGKVHVNFGQPIRLAEVLDAHNAAWRDETPVAETRPAWLAASIDQLMEEIATGINAAAVINPVNLVSLVLLSTPRLAMDEQEMVGQLDAYKRLATLAPYSVDTVVTPLDGAAMIAYCERLNMLEREKHPLGDVLYFRQEEAVLSTYMRNNILHMVALPALIACLVARNANLPAAQLRRLARTVYPFLRAELFLRWDEHEVDAAFEHYFEALTTMGWLRKTDDGSYTKPKMHSEEYAHLVALGQTIRPTLIRYFITLATLNQKGSGAVTPEELESLCHLQAQRLSLLREFNAPEFFDKAIFRTFIATLQKSGYADLRSDGKLHFDARMLNVSNEARYVLPPDVRQTILHMTRPEPAAQPAIQQASPEQETT